MTAELAHLRDFGEAELIFDEQETKDILKFFFLTDHRQIDSSQVTPEMRNLAQGLLVEAIDATFAMGWIELAFRWVANPGAGMKKALQKLARRAVRYWFGLAAVAYGVSAAYVVTTQGIEDLLLCSDGGGLKVPFSNQLCRSYLFAFRGTPQDIASLQRGIGASFVLQGVSPLLERERTLKFLISKGLRVNELDMHGATPLHAAVLANSSDEIEVLLRNGADVNVKDQKFGLTPLGLALKLQRDGKVDRHAVISILMNVK
jgi:Ankyrin repeats (many copies)